MILVYIKVFIDILVCIDTVYIRVKEFKKEKVRSSYLAFILILTFLTLFMLKEVDILNTYYITLYLTFSMLIFLILIPFFPELILSFLEEKTFVNFSKLVIYISIVLFFIIYFLLYCFDLNITISNYYFKILYKLRYFDIIFLLIYFIFMYLSKNLFDFNNSNFRIMEKLDEIFYSFIVLYFFRLIFIIMIIPVLI